MFPKSCLQLSLVLLVLSFVLFPCHNAYSQIFKKFDPPSESPNFPVSLAFGAGANYGLIGMKSIIGRNNTGLLVGIGRVEGQIFGQLGFQLASKNGAYVNIGYGPYKFVVFDNKEQTIYGGTLMGGIMLDLIRNRRLFLDLGLGLLYGSSYKTAVGETARDNGFTFQIGIGYRIGNTK